MSGLSTCAVLAAVQSEKVALNKAMPYFSTLSPHAAEAVGAAAAGRTAAAVELAFPSQCLHPPSPTRDQVSADNSTACRASALQLMVTAG